MESRRYQEDDFQGYVEELVDANRFADAKETGIAKQVVDNGYDSLSAKQKFVFEQSMSYFVHNVCDRCGIEVPWCEMFVAEDNGLCGYCAHMTDKNKD